MKIVIPMAGRGSRFADAGYELPKPLIDVNGMPMIKRVINNLKPKIDHEFIFICQKDHLLKYNLGNIINSANIDFRIVEIETITNGAACTVLLAKEYIDNEDMLMIANCDQFVDININDYILESKKYDGFIMTMKAQENKWSYIKYDDQKRIIGVVEKKVVSEDATVGIYNFSKGKLFVKSAEKMIQENDRVNNEFYVAPCYTYLAKEKFRIGTYDISGKMHGIGTPDDLKNFLKKEII